MKRSKKKKQTNQKITQTAQDRAKNVREMEKTMLQLDMYEARLRQQNDPAKTKVPLVYYNEDGTRNVVGKAEVEVKDDGVDVVSAKVETTESLPDSVTQALFGPPGSYSIAEDK